MSVTHRFRARLVAALVAALALSASVVGAQEEGASERERIRALEQQVEELHAELRAARAAGEDPRLDELERRIELLAAELERIRLGEAAVEATESLHGLGPAASKVYARKKGVSIGGYGEVLFRGPSGKRDDGAPSGESRQLDLLRAIVYVGYKWNDDWLFNSELEWEHAKVGEEAEGEAAIEFAYVDRLIRPEVNVRAGLVLVPMGLVNELHEPTVFRGARRPGVERVILPTTWRENGVGLYGDLGGFSYRTYVLAGLDAAGFSSGSGVRGGRQEGSESIAEDLAWVGRLDWTATPGLLAGGALYYGDSGQGLVDPDGGPLEVTTRILELHADWRWRGFEARALWADVALDDVAGLNRALGLTGGESVGDSMEGYYLEAGYDLFTRRPGDERLVPFARWESYDTQASVPAGFARDAASDVEILTIGVQWHPFEQVVVKADWQDVDNGAGTGVDQFNLALGYVF